MNTITWSVTADPGKWDVTIDGTTESISMDFYKAIVSHAQKLERDRIVGIIEGRKSVHVGFIEGAREAGVEPTDSIYTAISELNAILRAI